MSRPISFGKFAPPAGLQIGSGIAQGLNSAMANYAKMKMQHYQMQTQRMNAQAMQQWRTAQAETARQKTLGSSLQDIQLMQLAAKGGHADPKILRPLLQEKYQSVLDSAKPEEKTALMQHMDQQINQGDIPGEIAGGINLNMNQLKSLGQMQGNQSKETIATGKNDTAITVGAGHDTAKVQVGADAYRQGRESVTGGAGKADLQYMKDTAAQMRQISTQMANLDKPPAFGAPPLDDQTKAALKAQYGQQLTGLHDQYNQIHSKLSSGAAGATAGTGGAQGGPGAPLSQSGAQPKIYTFGQHDGAQPGDFINTPNGQMKVIGHNGTEPMVAPIQGAQPQQPASSQVPPLVAAPQGQ